MGVQITELIPKKEARLEDFAGKTIAVDASNHLYQFLTTIRAPDGALFTDSKGNVTSHLIGLFSRTAHLMKLGVRPVYVFDGEVPELKRREIKRRTGLKEEAAARYVKAEQDGDTEGMRKYAARSSRLTRDMVAEAKKVVEALGLPAIQAPGEGEAQAALMVSKGDAYAIASQDADSLLFGAGRVVRNLSIEGRRKQAGALSYDRVQPELILLGEVLGSLGISQEQLICLAMLVGTDYNPGGIKGVGPKNALKLVKEHKSPETIFSQVKWQESFDYSWEEVFRLFTNPNATSDYSLTFSSIKRDQLLQVLCDDHNFSRQRVEKTLEELEKSNISAKQKGLGEFFGR